MNTSHQVLRPLVTRQALLMLAFAGVIACAMTSAFAQNPGDPPARVATLSHIQGSVVFAPAGETDWVDATINRPITSGDRLWTDKGSRAELHVGSAVLHVDGTTFLDVTTLDGEVLQTRLNEGTVNARVRQLQPRENFEVDTPQLAFRATQAGDYRIDVDPVAHTTRVTVRSGVATVYGASGQAQRLEGAQLVTFAGPDLERVAVQASPRDDGFDRWAADRNRIEDQSVTARYVPREVVGYQQLDTHGTWAQDTSYGEVWYPRVTVADWAPYRYGRWEFISPWGWTWIDDAPWGFAPFHYGRWAMIASRWAWVPGRIGPRPVYAPALVVFVGGNNWSLSIGDPGIGWFPLGPGEAWRPSYRASDFYTTRVNRYAAFQNGFSDGYIHQRQALAVTAVRVEDFNRGRPVHGNWQRMSSADLGRAQVQASPSMPQPRRFFEGGRPMTARSAPQLSGPATALRQPPVFQGAQGGDERPRALVAPPRPLIAPPQEDRRWQQPLQRDVQRPRMVEEQQRPQVRQEDTRRRDEQRALDEQRRAQAQQAQQQDRARRDQQVHQERVQRDQQVQVQTQREHAARQQQEQVQRHQQEQVQQRHQQAAQEQPQRHQQAAQEQAQRHQQQQVQQQQQRAVPALQREEVRQVAPAQQPASRPEGRAHGRRGSPEQRDQQEDRRSQAGDEGGRSHGRGRS